MISDEVTEDSTPYVGIILGSFGGIFVIMIVIVFFLYRYRVQCSLDSLFESKIRTNELNYNKTSKVT